MSWRTSWPAQRPRSPSSPPRPTPRRQWPIGSSRPARSEEHTSELQSHRDLHSFPTRRSSDLDELEDVVASTAAAIAVIATPADAAQAVADRLVEAGVTSILNFAPTVLGVPEGVNVRKVDLGQELQILAYHERRARVDDPGVPR